MKYLGSFTIRRSRVCWDAPYMTKAWWSNWSLTSTSPNFYLVAHSRRTLSACKETASALRWRMRTHRFPEQLVSIS